MERKSSKQNSVVFWVEGEKFKLRNLPSRTSSLLSSAASSIGTSLEFVAFGSGPDAKLRRAIAFCFFFCLQPGFCCGLNTFSQQKHPRV